MAVQPKSILIAADSFKEALSAREACEAIGRGVKLAWEQAPIRLFPMADGGEGTAKILTQNTHGQWLKVKVADPLFRPVEAGYGLSPDGHTAFIDMAEASGLSRLTPSERNPLKTTTLGTGELMLHAIRKGASRIILGIGGSATNDAGLGLAQALGIRFLDERGTPVLPTGENLVRIHKIDSSKLKVDLSSVQIEVLSDVDNPLYGPEGAAHVYGAQKGADPESVALLDEGLRHFDRLFPAIDFGTMPGAGAAGGLGAGAIAFLGARLQPGITTIMALTGFAEALREAQLVITGEGKIDGQSLRGKVIGGICRKAQPYRVPVIALCGSLEAAPDVIDEMGLLAAFSINPSPQTLAQAIARTAINLENTAFQVMRTRQMTE